MVTILGKPKTLEGRNLAVQRYAREELARFEAKSKRRKWVAENLNQRREMAQWGSILKVGETGKVRDLLLGSFATELTEPIYVEEALRASGSNRVYQRFYEDFWGPQEERHWKALKLCLSDSELMTHEQIRIYSNECSEADPWSFEKQTGHKGYDIVWATAYALLQEGQTKLTYIGMCEAIWEQYGSPRDASGRKLYPAICGVIRLIYRDEGAHQAFFLHMMRIYLRYWPDRALEALAGVIQGYMMPVVFIPNADRFVEAVIWAKLNAPRWVLKSVINEGTKSLGLHDRKATRRALKNFGSLFDGVDAVVQLPGKPFDDVPEGCPVYELALDGSFVLVKAAA